MQYRTSRFFRAVSCNMCSQINIVQHTSSWQYRTNVSVLRFEIHHNILLTVIYVHMFIAFAKTQMRLRVFLDAWKSEPIELL